MENLKKIIDKILMSILVTQGICLIFIIGISVFFRYILGAALSWPEEVAGIIFVWYTLLGIVVLAGSETHIAFDFLEKSLPPIVGSIIRLFSQLAVTLYGIIMAVYGWKYLLLFPDETSPASGINLAWLKISVPIAGVLLIFFVSFNFLASSKIFNSNKGDAA